MTENTKDTWDAKLYATSFKFVPALADRVVSLLSPQPTDTILDIGCGPGTLTAQIAAEAASTMGLDASESMILTAKISSPASLETAGGKVEYQVHDCRRLPTTIQNYETGFQKIFSNAALHWILAGDTDRRQFFVDAFEKLQPGGVFVAEAGGWGNVEAVRVALAMALARRGLLAVEPWWFGSEDEYRELLQSAGFEVEVMEMEYRPTKVDGGVHQWVEMFCSTILAVVEDDGERAAVVKEAVDAVESVVKRSDGVWVAYVRVRFVARKPKD